MNIYDDGSVIEFPDGTGLLISSFNPYIFGSVLGETTYFIKDEDTLFSIASNFYGDTRMWYAIAEWNNNIDSPLELVTGLEIKLPNFGQ